MKRFSVILLSAVFSFALYSCGDGDDPVYAEYQEYPGDLAALGFSGAVNNYLFTIQKIKYDGFKASGDIEELFFKFDAQGNLQKLIFNSAKVESPGIPSFFLNRYDKKIESYIFSGRDQMGRITLRTILDGSDNPVATTSYIYDDDKQKCRITYKELEQEVKEKISSALLDKYGYYGAMFSVDFKNRDMLNRYLKNLPKEKPDDGTDSSASIFEEDGFHYMIKTSCMYY